jgi:hypothetical protein
MRIESELRFAIRRALSDACAKIPVPQRDLHIGSTTDESAQDSQCRVLWVPAEL